MINSQPERVHLTTAEDSSARGSLHDFYCTCDISKWFFLRRVFHAPRDKQNVNLVKVFDALKIDHEMKFRIQEAANTIYDASHEKMNSEFCQRCDEERLLLSKSDFMSHKSKRIHLCSYTFPLICC